MPPVATKTKYGKYLQVLHFDPPHPQRYLTSVKSEEPIDELAVQVWLLYHHPNFKYCTLFIRQTDGQTNGETILLLDALGGPVRLGA